MEHKTISRLEKPMASNKFLSAFPKFWKLYVASMYSECGHHRSGHIGDQEKILGEPKPGFHSLRSNKNFKSVD
jgi:hypothetical protein